MIENSDNAGITAEKVFKKIKTNNSELNNILSINEIEKSFKSLLISLYIESPEKAQFNSKEVQEIVDKIKNFDKEYLDQEELLLAKILCSKISSNPDYTSENILFALLNIKLSKLEGKIIKNN
ncbi:hypothetical protein [Methanosphaera sp.]|uniref:hypothetical protein n=1 Tax=Methanosphaera sp. TaxID=2666342 RepID=UPI0025DF8779|nr:hypothetical protein [Methanosphaera sp.]